MKISTKIIVLIATVSMIAVFFVPVWEISLQAPQYPEGLGMKIWINKITGDLRTINGLNHYIGMKTIEPDSIQELKIMPYILGFLILFGFIVWYKNKKSLLLTWLILLVIAGVIGGVDFWLWEYDYGHHLDPKAAIKVPGMNYQPPLIGSKQLLNFTANSYPDIGGAIIILTGLVVFILLIYEFKYNRPLNVKN